jgi:hypothetical protein
MERTSPVLGALEAQVDAVDHVAAGAGAGRAQFQGGGFEQAVVQFADGGWIPAEGFGF